MKEEKKEEEEEEEEERETRLSCEDDDDDDEDVDSEGVKPLPPPPHPLPEMREKRRGNVRRPGFGRPRFSPGATTSLPTIVATHPGRLQKLSSFSHR